MTDKRVSDARERRKHSTASEKLLWSNLRAKQLSGLQFRRQHPIDPFIADPTCPARKPVVEIDGGYHDLTGEQDVEAVARAFTKHVSLESSFQRRSGGGDPERHAQGRNNRTNTTSRA